MDQPAEQVAAPDPIEIDQVGRQPVGHHRRGKRWLLPERAVWPVLVVMRDVGRKDVLEVAAADDQEPVEALAAHSPDPALGVVYDENDNVTTSTDGLTHSKHFT